MKKKLTLNRETLLMISKLGSPPSAPAMESDHHSCGTVGPFPSGVVTCNRCY